MDNEVRIRVTSTDQSGPGFRSATNTAESAGSRISGALGKLAPVAAGVGTAIAAGMAVATVAAAGLKKALDASIERASVGAKIGAQTGMVDPKRVGELGRLAGKVYADNFGESLEQAGQAVRDVIRNRLVPADAGDDAVKTISEKLLTLGQIAESDSAEVSRAVHKMLVTGMATSAAEAIDIITRGVQTGADEAGDLLDTFDEYSIQFKELGINGKEALGLISQGLKGGARDADTVADALKEIAIRAKDGSKLSADGFKLLGLDAKQLGPMFAAGGDQARKALDMVIDKTKLIKDPMMQNAVATALFGTKSEDLQDALFGLDLDTAVTGLGDIAGAADRAGAALGGGLGNQIETFKRKAQQTLADVGDKIAPFIESVVTVWKGFGDELADVFDGSEVPGDVMESLRTIAEDYGPKLKEVLGSVVDKVRENKGAFETLGHILADVVLPVLGFLILDALVFVGAAIENCIRVIGFMVESWQALNRVVVPALAEFLQFLLGFFGSVINAAAKAFGWIPGIGPKLEKAAEEFNEFARKANNALSNIKDHDVYVRTHFVGGQGQARGGEYRTGGITGGMSAAATGGIRSGLVKVGEEGEEFIRTPTGSMVYSKANTNQMQAMAGASAGGGASRLHVEFGGDLDSAMAQWFMNAQRTGQVTIYATAIN